MKWIVSVAGIAVASLAFGATGMDEPSHFVITQKSSDQVLTLSGSANPEGAAVVLSPFQNQPGQGFELKPVGDPKDQIYTIVSKQSGQCLDVKDGSREDGAAIIQKSCNGAECQVFHVSNRGADGHRELRNQLSGKCLAPPRSGDSGLIQTGCNGQDSQRFRISPLR